MHIDRTPWDVDWSRGEKQCPSTHRFPYGDVDYSCRYRVGHPGKHRDGYNKPGSSEWTDEEATGARTS